jgi:hypothetical protein
MKDTADDLRAEYRELADLCRFEQDMGRPWVPAQQALVWARGAESEAAGGVAGVRPLPAGAHCAGTWTFQRPSLRDQFFGNRRIDPLGVGAVSTGLTSLFMRSPRRSLLVSQTM